MYKLLVVVCFFMGIVMIAEDNLPGGTIDLEPDVGSTTIGGGGDDEPLDPNWDPSDADSILPGGTSSHTGTSTGSTCYREMTCKDSAKVGCSSNGGTCSYKIGTCSVNTNTPVYDRHTPGYVKCGGKEERCNKCASCCK